MSAKALLNPTPPSGEQVRVDSVLKMAEEMIGFVPAGMRLYGLSPTMLEMFAGTVGYFRSETALSPVLTTMIRYLVSEQAGCQFCIDLNEGFLDSMGESVQDARAARLDLSKAPVADNEQPLLALALKSVSDPKQVSESDIQACRTAGWADREIFDAVLQAASNRAFNNVLNTFKVETQDAFI